MYGTGRPTLIYVHTCTCVFTTVYIYITAYAFCGKFCENFGVSFLCLPSSFISAIFTNI